MNPDLLFAVSAMLLLTSCSAKLTSSIQRTYAPLDEKKEVRVFEMGEAVPFNAEILGTLKVDDSGFSTKCSYPVVLDQAKAETRRVGGNALKITEHKLPDLWSTCHRIAADVLKIDSVESYLAVAGTGDADSTSAGTDQAVIRIYKPSERGSLAIAANDTPKSTIPHFRVAVDGGWQYRTAKLAEGLTPELKEHYKKLKSGFHYDLQAGYFFAENMGVEALFSQQFFGNTLGYGSLTDATGHSLGSGEWREKMVFSYIGANYLIRHFNAKRKNCWVFSFGLGYMGYKDKMHLEGTERIKLTAGTLGSNLAIGYDIGVSENFGIGFKVSFMGGTFRKFQQTIDGITTQETMPDNTSEGLGTLKLSVGFRFNK